MFMTFSLIRCGSEKIERVMLKMCGRRVAHQVDETMRGALLKHTRNTRGGVYVMYQSAHDNNYYLISISHFYEEKSDVTLERNRYIQDLLGQSKIYNIESVVQMVKELGF